jgi:hypothetical protein
MGRPNKILKYIAILFWLLSLGNAIDLFFSSNSNLKVVRGEISSVKIGSFPVYHKYGKSMGSYITTNITLGKNDYIFFSNEKDGRDSLLRGVRVGEKVELYVRRWYHYITYFGLGANMFLVKRDGEIIYDITDKCRRANKIFMIVCALVAMAFSLIYLDVNKNLSIENWFRKRFIKKKDDWIEVN